MVYDVETAIEATALKVGQAFGIRLDKVNPILDEYGVDLVLAALKTVEGEIADGYRPSSPFGYMISLLRKGVIQAQAIQVVDPAVKALHARYHNDQADPKRDTPAKRLARAAGYNCVKCSCGASFRV